MTFTREDLANYAAGKAEIVPDAPVPEKQPDATPSSQDSAEASSASEETVPTELVEDGSSEDVIAESSAAPAEDTDSAKSEDELKPRKNDARERIEELITERNAIRKYAGYMLSEVERLKAEKAPAPTAAVEADQKADPMPTLEDHQYDPIAFAKAQNEWIERQVDIRTSKAVSRAMAQATAEQQLAQVRSSFETRVNDFKKAHTDFDTVISNPNLPELANKTASLIVKSESGPAIAYHLAKNPDLAARISRMDPDSQAMAIGRIEAQLTAAPVKKASPAQRTVSNAPPPPKPVSSGSGNIAKQVSDMSMDEFVAHERNLKMKERENRRRARSAMK